MSNESTADVGKTHYRKAFNSPYLSSSDIVEPTVLTIKTVVLEIDRTKRTKDMFNTAYFEEKFIRPGEGLKPMILNSVNSMVVKNMAGSPYLEDWRDIRVAIYVDKNIKFGRSIVEGLRINPRRADKETLTPANAAKWGQAEKAFLRDGNLDKILAKVNISKEHQEQLRGAQ